MNKYSNLPPTPVNYDKDRPISRYGPKREDSGSALKRVGMQALGIISEDKEY